MFVNFNILNQLGSPAINSNTFANRPAAGQTGRLFVSTDTFEIYRDNGTTWDLIGGPGSSTITGTGTANYITKFTGSQSIGNSIMTEGTGLITITGTNPRFVVGGTDDASSQLQTYSNVNTRWKFQVSSDTSTDDADITGYKSRGTIAAPTAILAGDSITNYSGRGYDGTVFLGGGGIDIFAEENYTPTAAGSYLILQTTSIGATGETEKIRLTANGNLGINTSTPGAKLDVHSTGTIAQLNSTGATNNGYLAFQRAGATTFSIGDTYNGGTNYFRIFGQTLGADILQIFAATGKTQFQATQTYTTGLARGNYFAYNLTAAAGTTFSSPNTIEALGASLNLSLGGNATIPSGARSGLDAYNTVSFTGTGTLTHSQGTQIRAYSNLTTGWAFAGSATGTITHLAGLRVLFPDNSGSAVTITNNYGLLINDQTANTGTVTYTNRWGIYQEGATDLNYLNANTLIGTTTNSGEKLNVNGNINIGSGFWLRFASVNTIFSQGGVGFFIQQPDASTNTEFRTSTGTSLMTLNVNGILGLRQSPFNWANGTTAIDFGSGSSLWNPGSSTQSYLLTNAYYDNTDNRYEYKATGGASMYAQIGNEHRWYNAISGTANNPITWTQAMTLDASGRLGIGTTSQTQPLTIQANTSAQAIATFGRASDNTSSINFFQNNGTTRLMQIGISPSAAEFYYDANAPILFYTNATERARITSGGNFLLGTTTDNGQKFQVNGNTLLNGTLQFTVSGLIQPTLQRNGSSGGLTINTTATATNANVFEVQNNGVNKFIIVSSTDAAEFAGSIKTAAPTTGTAAEWKLGSRVAATVVLDTTQYIQLDVGGTLYKLAIVT